MLRSAFTSLIATTMLAMPAWADTPVAAAEAPATDPLLEAFASPPAEARPRVWWHWMNGNITVDGIAKDLDWMHRIGIGGVQIFDANLATPQVVAKRLAYMTPEWKEAFRFATTKAAGLGMEVAVAASPGWSETGGPWVKPEDGIKKLVWSETVVLGGKRFAGLLSLPPVNAGPYLDLMPDKDAVAAANGEKQFEASAMFRDIAVFAYRLPGAMPLPMPKSIAADGKALEMTVLTDASLLTAVPVGRGSASAPTTIVAEYETPQEVRSLTFFAPGAAEKFGAPGYLPWLEASDDGKAWRKIADFAVTTVPSTVSFAPVTARLFRVVLQVNPSGGLSGFTPAAGVDLRPVLALLAPKPSLPLAEFRLSNEARVHQFEAKAGFATVLDYASLAGPPVAEPGLGRRDIINLSGRLAADGSLHWTPPAGRWRIVRMGWSLTGKTNHPAPLEATGLEVDKLDGAAVRRYLETYLAMVRDAAGPDTIRALLTDSTEVGSFNWTPGLADRFRQLRGYHPEPWFPVLTGAVVGSAAQSDAFLHDFRQTIGELHASEHYGTVAAVAHEHGLKVYGEALEDRRPSLGDDMAMRRNADYPMAALWTWQRGEKPRSTLLGDLKGASSVAHLYGQNIAAAESMTSALQYWAQAPSDLRRVIDLEFAAGINRPVIHSSVHQPVDDKQPGLSLLIFGQYFNRHETWADMAKPWIDYLSRSSFLLQQGRNHADLAYFAGEDMPLTAQFADAPLADVPTGYAYDFVNRDALLQLLKVDGGDLITPGGARYRALYLGAHSDRISLPVLRRIAELAENGATIIGTAPKGSPALQDDPGEYAELQSKLWPGIQEAAVGKGRVIAERNVEHALVRSGLKPDFSFDRSDPAREVLFVHRKLDAGDIYFVNNRRDQQDSFEARFRVAGRAPEIWHADTGKAEPVSYRIEGEETIVPLTMGAEDSFFVIFRKAAAERELKIPMPTESLAIPLDRDWTVTFQPDRGAPSSITLEKLVSLSENADPRVKFFSGTATYTTTFRMPKTVRPGQPLLLDLGSVADVAEIVLNGRTVGTVWHSPYRQDIGRLVRRGRNVLEVRVANLWVNRLIGDAAPGAQKITFTTLPTYTARAPLRRSGLIGPVRLLTLTD